MIEDSKELCRTIADNLQAEEHFDVVGIAYDGETGIDLILETRPDVVLIDIILPKMDGLSVLKKLQSSDMDNIPACIMLTSVSQDSITANALEWGADYYILKPFNMRLLAERIVEVHQYKRDHKENRAILMDSVLKVKEPEDFVVKLLHVLGMAANLKGYAYVKRAIILGINDSKNLNSMTKILYPMIGKEFSTSANNVERAIRNVIENSWDKGNNKNFAKVFGSTRLNDNKPTNSTFISLAVEQYIISGRK